MKPWGSAVCKRRQSQHGRVLGDGVGARGGSTFTPDIPKTPLKKRKPYNLTWIVETFLVLFQGCLKVPMGLAPWPSG